MTNGFSRDQRCTEFRMKICLTLWCLFCLANCACLGEKVLDDIS